MENRNDNIKEHSEELLQLRARVFELEKRVMEQQAAKELLREQEETFRLFADWAYDWEYWVDPNGRVIYMSPSCERVTGYEPKVFMDEPDLLYRIVHPEDRRGYDEHYRSIRTANECAEEAHQEFRIIARDGSEHWIDHKCRPVYHPDGAYLGRRVSNRDITDNKKTEEALRAGEVKYREVFCTSRDSVFVTSPDGRWLDFNESAMDLFGYESRTALSQVQIFQLYANAEDRASFLAIVQRQGFVKEHPVKLKRKNGEVFDSLITASCLRDADGSVTGFAGTIRDVTERKQAEEALRESEEKLKGISVSVQDAVILVNDAGDIEFWNPAAERIFGYKASESLGKNVHKLLAPPELVDAYNTGVRRFAETGGGAAVGSTLELQAVRRNGDRFPVELSLSSFQIAGRWHAVGAARDITERKKAEEALSESEERYRELVEMSDDMAYRTDADGVFNFANRVASKITGYSEAELIGLHYTDLIPPEYREKCEKFYGRQFVKRIPTTYYEWPVRMKTGELVWVGQNVQLIIRNEKVVGFQAIVRDITRSKNAEKALEESEKRYRSLFEDAPLIYVTTRNEHGAPIITDFNTMFLSTLGYTREEVHGRPLADFYTPESRMELLAHGGYTRALAGEFFLGERQLVARDGRLVPTLLYSAPEVDSSGRVTGARGMFVDISARKEAEEALQRSERLYRSVIENIEDVFYRSDADGKLLMASPSGATLFGYDTIDEMIGKSLKSVWVDQNERKRFLETVQKQGRVTDFEALLKKKDGSVLVASLSAHFYREEDGTLLGTEGIIRDISERHYIQTKLDVKLQELTAALETVSAQNELLNVVRKTQREFISDARPEELFKDLLQDLLTLTKSEFGFIGEILYTDDGRMCFRNHALTDISWDEESREIYQKFLDNKGFDFPDIRGLWGDVIRDGRPVFSNNLNNDPRSEGIPKGHPPIRSFLGIPFISESTVIGMAGIANRPGGYDMEHVEFLEPYVATCTNIIEAYRNVDRRKLAEKKLASAYAELEQKVLDRTAELRAANETLIGEIEERKRVEEALRQSEVRFRTVFQQSQDSMTLKDRSSRYIDANPAFQELLGLPLQKIVGRTTKELLGVEAALHIKEIEARVMRGETIEEENTRKIKGVPMTFLDTRSPLKDDSGNIIGILALSRDITDWKRVEAVYSSESKEEECRSTAMRATLKKAILAANSDSIVLLTGESGCGKDFLARYIHNHSARAGGPYFMINCAAIARELAESELFGHEKGAFSGAPARKRGLLELAEGGSLLINEIGELSFPLQAKLLTFLDSRQFTRVGGEKQISVNARLIFATNRDLQEDIRQGLFRKDIFYRINVVSIPIPPLRERAEDIPALVQSILSQLRSELRIEEHAVIGPGVIKALQSHNWPGNVRELRNVMERALMVSGGRSVDLANIHPLGGDRVERAGESYAISFADDHTLQETTDEVAKILCMRALERSGGNKTAAARDLGISRDTLYRYMEKFEISDEN